MIAEGAGSEMRHALGVTVFSGMLGVTIMGILFTPVFFYVIESIGKLPLFKTKTAKVINKGATQFISIATMGLLTTLRKKNLNKGGTE